MRLICKDILVMLHIEPKQNKQSNHVFFDNLDSSTTNVIPSDKYHRHTHIDDI